MEITKLRKGAIVSYPQALSGGTLSVIKFQYNPTSLTRNLSCSFSDANGIGKDAFKMNGAPSESIRLQAEFDSGDTEDDNIKAKISALEILTYPSARDIIKRKARLLLGEMEVTPFQASYVLFVWGTGRIVPVQVMSVSVTEQQFNARLDPIRATIDLSLRVLSCNNLSVTHPAYYQYISYQKSKERLAKKGTTDSLDDEFGEMNL